MEPPHFGLSRYALRWWRSVRPDSARKNLLRQANSLSAFQQYLLTSIYDRLPDRPYQDLEIQQRFLVDAGIYIAGNQFAQAAAICKEISSIRSTDQNWIEWLHGEIENAMLMGKPQAALSSR